MRRSESQYYPYYRVERIISFGRMSLTGFFLLALIIDPSKPTEFFETTLYILAGYFAYATGLVLALQKGTALTARLPLLLHCIDLTLFTAVMFYSDGPGSPFVIYYVFLLICATMRWQWRGTIGTACVSISAMLFMVFQHRGPMHGDNHDLYVIIIRISYLLVLTGILGYLGAHEHKLRATLAKLAFWSQPAPFDLHTMLEANLSRAAVLLKAPRMLLIWEDQDEPWLSCAVWAEDELNFMRESPAEFDTFIIPQLQTAHFYTPDLQAPWPNVTLIEERRLRTWEGAEPFSHTFLERFAIRSMLCIPVVGKQFSGHILAFDVPNMTSDELVLGEIVAHEMAASMDHLYLQQELQKSMAQEERLRLARDLHDGILQSLTSVRLRLGAAQRLMATDPAKASTMLNEIQGLISTEQRELRNQIQQLRPLTTIQSMDKIALYDRLAENAERFRCHWPLEVALTCNNLTMTYDQGLSREILLLVHEGMVNVARHAKATTVRVQLTAHPGSLRIIITDDGHGFPFTGSYELTELNRQNLGPKTLRERTASLGGILNLDSTPTGSTVEILLPVLTSGDALCQ